MRVITWLGESVSKGLKNIVGADGAEHSGITIELDVVGAVSRFVDQVCCEPIEEVAVRCVPCGGYTACSLLWNGICCSQQARDAGGFCRLE